MKKVTMFLWNNFTNDARVLREGSALVNEGYSVTVIAKREEGEQLKLVEQLPNGIHVKRGQKPNHIFKSRNTRLNRMLTKHIPNAWLMMRMIKEGYRIPTDIYHSHDLNTLIQGVVCAKLRLQQKPLIFDSHEVNTSRTHYNTGLIYKVERALLKFVDYTIVENETRAEYHERLYGERPIAIHNYSELYDIKKVSSRMEFKDKKILLYQGGLQEGRGLPLLIDAFKEAEVDATLLLVGDGKIKRQLEEQVQRSGLEHRVIFTGRVPYTLLREYTKNAYIGFQILENTNFNHYSASSNKLYEYMMAHVPVIGTALPEISRVIKKEQTGLVIKDSDKKALADAIRYVVSHEAEHKKWQKNSERAKYIYNWEEEKHKLLNLYRTID